MTYLWFAAAVIVMAVAHFIRILRWELFIKVYEKPDLKRLLKALSLGYAINYVVPYKLGDLARGFYAGRGMKNGKALGLSTVIVDRYLDIFCVGLIFLGLNLFGGGESVKSASRFYIFFFFALILATVVIYLFKGLLKKLIRLVAGLFNARLEGSLLKFAWALIWNFKDIVLKINKLALLASSIGMWALYIASYYLFAMAFSTVSEATGWVDVFLMLFGETGVRASTVMLSLISGEMGVGQLYIGIFTVAPLLILFLVSLCLRKKKNENREDTDYLNLLPQLNPEERLVFLDKYFSDNNREYINNYLKINHGISIIRDYSAGSNATTMLCVDKRGTFFRKYAFGEDGKKLAEQIKWIEDNSSKIPLPKILEKDVNDFYCYYDMPFKAGALGLFEYAHSNPAEKSIEILKKVFDTLESALYIGGAGAATPSDTVISDYIRNKVTRNLNILKNSRRIKALTEYDTLIINGKTYRNLPAFEKYLTEDYLT
ncbi:MAG: flippase-like domain-containing protein, partial [Lachnospiraceae bacterium]|nr:flippase-like domain-containing protein [Lachnospiraceae bacterium]